MRRGSGKPFVQCYRISSDGCWLWGESLNGAGYGSKSFNGEIYMAHRLSWILHHGPIPKGINVLHRCDVRQCVNPEHLFLGTQSDNILDALAKGRAPQISIQDHCHKGHPLIGDNLLLENGGKIRRCLRCRLQSRNAYKLRKEIRCESRIC